MVFNAIATWCLTQSRPHTVRLDTQYSRVYHRSSRYLSLTNHPPSQSTYAHAMSMRMWASRYLYLTPQTVPFACPFYSFMFMTIRSFLRFPTFTNCSSLAYLTTSVYCKSASIPYKSTLFMLAILDCLKDYYTSACIASFCFTLYLHCLKYNGKFRGAVAGRRERSLCLQWYAAKL